LIVGTWLRLQSDRYSNQLAILKSIEISQKKSEFFPLTDFVPYRGHRDKKKSTAEPYHFFYIFLLNFQTITSAEQKNYKNLLALQICKKINFKKFLSKNESWTIKIKISLGQSDD
jgi:hypothetical protein